MCPNGGTGGGASGSTGGGSGAGTGGGSATGGGSSGSSGGGTGGSGAGGGTGKPKKGYSVCPAGALNCSDCSAASAISNGLATCLEGEQAPEERPGCTEDTCRVVPSDQGTNTRWSDCFSGSGGEASSALVCPGMRCGQGLTPTVVNGNCSCSAMSGSGSTADPCAYVRCSEDSTAVPVGGQCLCSSSGADPFHPAPGSPQPGVLLPWP
jgi:hypothetical protein